MNEKKRIGEGAGGYFVAVIEYVPKPALKKKIFWSFRKGLGLLV